MIPLAVYLLFSVVYAMLLTAPVSHRLAEDAPD